MVAGELGDALPVEQPGRQRLAQGDGIHAGVAGSDHHGIDVRVGAQGLDDGVLASTGSDDENLHTPSVETRGGNECAASRGGRGDILPGTPRSRRAVAWRGNRQPGTWVDTVDFDQSGP
ncbi:hypothetical protein GCM10009867_27000 [Pedococcus aerophilus]|uniref:Uncharacterized protein n=1 Tax=Pedococcus aerophilus TaxID=436356 RepID=A0ABN3US81_9MICO